VVVVRAYCAASARTAWELPRITKPEDMNVGQLIDDQHQLGGLLTAWTCQAVTRIGLSRTLLWLPKRVLLSGGWNRSARLDSQLKKLEGAREQRRNSKKLHPMSVSPDGVATEE
jgi:hypothetical protein